ncbi:MAG: YeeE/YedE family protein [Rhodomicrobium sp.]|nr:YeeE/YedE family protein [Rhodomicrobium sp.]
MEPLPAWAVPLCGGAIGGAIGYAARRGRLCTFGAIEDAFMGGEFRRLKVLALALAIALIMTQTAIVSGALAPDTIRYLPLTLPWLAIAAGGLAFGFGMALVGTCAFGSLIRFGSGDLRSFVTILVYALTALAVLRGGLASFRIAYIESHSIAMPGAIQADFAALMSWFAGFDLRPMVLAVIAAALLIWAVKSGEVLRMPRLLLSGAVLGIGAGAAWLVTGVLIDRMTLVVEPEGLTFVAPVADTLQAIAFPSVALLNFGVASVAGVIAGAFLASVRHDEFRWEAFDDQREMKRHIAGSVMMGVGGVLAGGCTIGQGITAGSVLALSWPLAVGAMMLGARAGLYYLLKD